MTQETHDKAEINYSSTLPVTVYTRPTVEPPVDWQEFDRGPGYFHIPGDLEIGVKIKGIDDRTLKTMVEELRDVETLRFIDLAENRNVTDAGLVYLSELKQVTILNLSSCTVSPGGINALKPLTRLERLTLSYCNKLNDSVLKTLEGMRSLEYVDLQGCLSVTRGAISRVRRRSLEIYR